MSSPALKSEQYSQLEDELKFGNIYSTILPRKSRDPIGKLFTERDYLSLGWRYRTLPHIYPLGKGASGGGDKESRILSCCSWPGNQQYLWKC